MAAVLGRPGGSNPPPAGIDVDIEEYECDCLGFRNLDLMQMCLRCLTAYSEGLEESTDLEPRIVQREMRRVAIRLAVILKDDPLLANLPMASVLRSREGSRL